MARFHECFPIFGVRTTSRAADEDARRNLLLPGDARNEPENRLLRPSTTHTFAALQILPGEHFGIAVIEQQVAHIGALVESMFEQ